jgi:hypothetical protein
VYVYSVYVYIHTYIHQVEGSAFTSTIRKDLKSNGLRITELCTMQGMRKIMITCFCAWHDHVTRYRDIVTARMALACHGSEYIASGKGQLAETWDRQTTNRHVISWWHGCVRQRRVLRRRLSKMRCLARFLVRESTAVPQHQIDYSSLSLNYLSAVCGATQLVKRMFAVWMSTVVVKSRVHVRHVYRSRIAAKCLLHSGHVVKDATVAHLCDVMHMRRLKRIAFEALRSVRTWANGVLLAVQKGSHSQGMPYAKIPRERMSSQATLLLITLRLRKICKMTLHSWRQSSRAQYKKVVRVNLVRNMGPVQTVTPRLRIDVMSGMVYQRGLKRAALDALCSEKRRAAKALLNVKRVCNRRGATVYESARDGSAWENAARIFTHLCRENQIALWFASWRHVAYAPDQRNITDRLAAACGRPQLQIGGRVRIRNNTWAGVYASISARRVGTVMLRGWQAHTHALKERQKTLMVAVSRHGTTTLLQDKITRTRPFRIGIVHVCDKLAYVGNMRRILNLWASCTHRFAVPAVSVIPQKCVWHHCSMVVDGAGKKQALLSWSELERVSGTWPHRRMMHACVDQWIYIVAASKARYDLQRRKLQLWCSLDGERRPHRGECDESDNNNHGRGGAWDDHDDDDDDEHVSSRAAARALKRRVIMGWQQRACALKTCVYERVLRALMGTTQADLVGMRGTDDLSVAWHNVCWLRACIVGWHDAVQTRRRVHDVMAGKLAQNCGINGLFFSMQNPAGSKKIIIFNLCDRLRGKKLLRAVWATWVHHSILYRNLRQRLRKACAGFARAEMPVEVLSNYFFSNTIARKLLWVWHDVAASRGAALQRIRRACGGMVGLFAVKDVASCCARHGQIKLQRAVFGTWWWHAVRLHRIIRGKLWRVCMGTGREAPRVYMASRKLALLSRALGEWNAAKRRRRVLCSKLARLLGHDLRWLLSGGITNATLGAMWNHRRCRERTLHAWLSYFRHKRHCTKICAVVGSCSFIYFLARMMAWWRASTLEIILAREKDKFAHHRHHQPGGARQWWASGVNPDARIAPTDLWSSAGQNQILPRNNEHVSVTRIDSLQHSRSPSWSSSVHGDDLTDALSEEHTLDLTSRLDTSHVLSQTRAHLAQILLHGRADSDSFPAALRSPPPMQEGHHRHHTPPPMQEGHHRHHTPPHNHSMDDRMTPTAFSTTASFLNASASPRSLYDTVCPPPRPQLAHTPRSDVSYGEAPFSPSRAWLSAREQYSPSRSGSDIHNSNNGASVPHSMVESWQRFHERSAAFGFHMRTSGQDFDFETPIIPSAGVCMSLCMSVYLYMFGFSTCERLART